MLHIPSSKLDCIRILLLLFAAFRSVYAQEQTFGGHVKYQGTYSDFDSNDSLQNFFDGRANALVKGEQYEFSVQGQILGAHLESIPPALLTNTRLLTDRTRFLDLTSIIDDSGSFQSEARLDRLYGALLTENAVIRIGRQAVSWGNGLVFHVLDPFNPFAPTAIDKEYKAGDDMLFGQYAIGTGSDIQILVVSHRDPITHDVEADESSFASKVHYRSNEAEADFDIVAAKHTGENFFGGGFSRDIFDAVFRTDIAFSTRESESEAFSLVSNIDRSFEVSGKNLYASLEYFRNGYGVSKEEYDTPSPDLIERITRGELYTLGRNYLSAGLRLELYPRTNIYTSVLWNMNDESAIAQWRAVQELAQNLNLIVGMNIPVGPSGSEYGGIKSFGIQQFELPVDTYIRLEGFF